jgi:signal transduction histidine kinase
MVTLHGGVLTVDSAINAGTTVTVTLPAERLLIRADKRIERSESVRQ